MGLGGDCLNIVYSEFRQILSFAKIDVVANQSGSKTVKHCNCMYRLAAENIEFCTHKQFARWIIVVMNISGLEVVTVEWLSDNCTQVNSCLPVYLHDKRAR